MYRLPLILFLTLVLAVSDAHAYVDPGSGMLLWQGLIAAIGAVLIFVRRPVQTLKDFIRRLRRK